MKTCSGYLLAVVALGLWCVLLAPSTTVCQTIGGSYAYERDSVQVRRLLCTLADGNLNAMPRQFFGDTYDDELPDLVVFVDQRANRLSDDSSAQFALLKGQDRRDELFGERFIYVVLFVARDKEAGVLPFGTTYELGGTTILYASPEDSRFVDSVVNRTVITVVDSVRKERSLAADHRGDSTLLEKIISQQIALDSAAVDSTVRMSFVWTNDPFVHLAPLDQRASSGEFALFAAIRIMAKVFLGETVVGREEKGSPADTLVPVRMHYVGEDGTACLYYTLAKLPLRENTINRITIGGIGEEKHLATFGNYSPSWFTTSIGVMSTFVGQQTSCEDSIQDPLVESFIFGHFYIKKRPQRPKPRFNDAWKEFRKRISVSLVVGTRLTDTHFFDDWFLGVGLGHVISTVAVVGGVNFRKSTSHNVKRKGHPAFGITFMF